ncbi:MAG: EamA family transporter, partial [Ignavibacteriae bacterium]|nr:EamA family transporter [Ignavibacteriota bacterium]
MEWFYIAFASAILSAIAAVLQKKVLFNLDALEFSFILSVFNLLLALILLPQLNYSQITATALIILYLKTILGAFAFLNVMLAIKNLEISGALPLMVLTPGIVAVLSLFFLGESITNLEIYGMILLLIGTYVLEIKKHDKLL